MAGKDTRYTHAQWRVSATALRDALRTQLVEALDHMIAGLRRVDAGKSQIAFMQQSLITVRELGDMGTTILGAHDARLRQVGEAQAHAGGLPEVAGDKNYNQR